MLSIEGDTGESLNREAQSSKLKVQKFVPSPLVGEG
jgi:hypothetical protein